MGSKMPLKNYSVFITLPLIACVPEILNVTFSEFTTHVETRFSADALYCGESDITDGIRNETNPEVTTCLYNALVNDQTAYGYYTSEVNSKRTDWDAYTLEGRTVEHYTYTQDISNPDNIDVMYGSVCEKSSLPKPRHITINTLFDCEVNSQSITY